MRFLKLKHPLVCRIATYVVFVGIWIIPMVAVICIPMLPDLVKVLASLACMAGLLGFLVRNFAILMGMDIFLGTLQGCKGAYRQYPLKTDAKTLEKRLSRFGQACEPRATMPKPQILRYKSTAPINIYSSGIEKVVAVYPCGLLTKTEYQSIVNSAVTNSQALAGKKKHRLLDKAQKTSPLNRVTVILILASSVEPSLSQSLYDLVCKNEGDGYDVSVLPCVVDLSAKTCVFNSSREPYYGMQYPVKNRGIRLIKKYVFGGKFPKGTGELLEEVDDFDTNQSLWTFWKELKNEFRDQDQKTKKHLGKLKHGQILVRGEEVLIKLEDRGTVWPILNEDETSELQVMISDHWDYPKMRPMSKKHIGLIKGMVQDYFALKGKIVRFVTMEDDA